MSYPIIAGMPVIPQAEIAAIAGEPNLTYPNGIGKRDGMFVLVDEGAGVKALYMANGKLANSKWTKVGDGALPEVVTPA